MKKKEDMEKESEYQSYLGKIVKILLTNNYSYTGKVLEVNENSLTILDKFEQKVTFHLNSIMIITEVNNNGSPP